MIFGITGGTGCGKTTALRAIEALGGHVFDCDAIYHDLLKTDKDLLLRIETRFPGVVEDGQLQRKRLGAIVFADENALADLNDITHGAVCEAVKKGLAEHPGLAAIDAIALMESGLAKLCDVTVAITAPREDRIARLMKRDNITAEYAALRIDAQKSDAYFASVCDHVLCNNERESIFYQKCIAFFQQYNIIETESY